MTAPVILVCGASSIFQAWRCPLVGRARRKRRHGVGTDGEHLRCASPGLVTGLVAANRLGCAYCGSFKWTSLSPKNKSEHSLFSYGSRTAAPKGGPKNTGRRRGSS